jgi:dephospho-CoA kinase
MLNVGLTGGIATGKTTVAGMFREKGADLIDFDILTRYVEEPDRPAWKAIVDFFGTAVLNGDSTINREKLGAIVFQDKTKLAKLNDIVHPFVLREWRRRIDEIRKSKPEAIVISDIPLLIETGLQNLFDVIVLVYATPERQLERLIARNGCTHKNALKRLASQLTIDEKVPYAHMVIDNSSSWKETRRAVETTWKELKKRGLKSF